MDVDAAPALKRKGAEAPELWLDDDGPGFPVSSRATKIRRLDADVPLVMPSAGVPPPLQQPQTQPVEGFGAEEVPLCGDVATAEVAPALVAPNEERAIVLYRPAEAACNLLLGPLRPGVPLRVSPDWIHGLKDSMLQVASNRQALIGALARDESSNLAMVPWAPSHFQAASTAPSTVTKMMDADQDMEGTSMEVEQDSGELFWTASTAMQGVPLHQWPQQCMVQPPLPATSYQPSPVRVMGNRVPQA